MEIATYQAINTISGERVLRRAVDYDKARKQVERRVDLTAYDPKPAVLSVYAQVFWGCDHAIALPDGRQEWVNDITGDRVRLEASL